ncbi:hypothetical protein [Georgenia yuyongxinii]
MIAARRKRCPTAVSADQAERTIDGLTVVAREQVILDGYGGIDRMAEQSDILLGRRVA